MTENDGLFVVCGVERRSFQPNHFSQVTDIMEILKFLLIFFNRVIASATATPNASASASAIAIAIRFVKLIKCSLMNRNLHRKLNHKLWEELEVDLKRKRTLKQV